MTMRAIAAEVALIRRRDAEAYEKALDERRYEDTYKMDAEIVRAVLEAIREPTGTMIEAGEAYMCWSAAQPPVFIYDNGSAGRWRAMVDAVLQERP